MIDKLYGYTMTVNIGFAPNYGMPEAGKQVCTLACCKWPLRRALGKRFYNGAGDLRKKNIWLLGIAGVRVEDVFSPQPRTYPRNSPIFLMQVTKILTFSEYFDRYAFKKWPEYDNRFGCFDNFYDSDAMDINCEILKNRDGFDCFAHNKSSCAMHRDLCGQYVLCSDNYYNFNGEIIDEDEYRQACSECFNGSIRNFTYSKMKPLMDFFNDRLSRLDHFKRRILKKRPDIMARECAGCVCCDQG